MIKEGMVLEPYIFSHHYIMVLKGQAQNEAWDQIVQIINLYN